MPLNEPMPPGVQPDGTEYEHNNQPDHRMANGLRAMITALPGSLTDNTVMHCDRDPFRLDTPAYRRDATWLRDTWDRMGIKRPIHVRGLHYALLGQPRPEDPQRAARSARSRAAQGLLPKEGDDSTYSGIHFEWLEQTATVARWLGYIPFEWIVDERNDAPVSQPWEPAPAPHRWIYQPTGVLAVEKLREVRLPDADELKPTAQLADFAATQPYRIALFGEKTSLRDVLGEVAEQYGCDLFLAAGDMSNTLVHDCAKAGAADPRPLRILYFSDADPSGHTMGIVLSRKLAALKAVWFPELEFQVHRVALTVRQVRELGLPSTPFKPGEDRADAWFQATGTYQTEIDSLATLAPDRLRRIAVDMIGHFHDTTLASRVATTKRQWRQQAQAVLDRRDDLAQARADAAERLAEIDEQLAELADEIPEVIASAAADVKVTDLPALPEIPRPRPVELGAPEPLCDSSWSFAEQTRRLLASKRYEDV